MKVMKKLDTKIAVLPHHEMKDTVGYPFNVTTDYLEVISKRFRWADMYDDLIKRGQRMPTMVEIERL